MPTTECIRRHWHSLKGSSKLSITILKPDLSCWNTLRIGILGILLSARGNLTGFSCGRSTQTNRLSGSWKVWMHTAPEPPGRISHDPNVLILKCKTEQWAYCSAFLFCHCYAMTKGWRTTVRQFSEPMHISCRNFYFYFVLLRNMLIFVK